MTSTRLLQAGALVAIIATGVTIAATAQTTTADPYHPGTMLPQATPPAAPETMGQGTMGQGTMGRGMMPHGKMRMHGPRMKILFAIADANGDGALSFEEITTIHKRIFDKIDVNKDGKVTPEEIEAYFRD
jgi:hypothetical protein